jgi:germination protein M
MARTKSSSSIGCLFWVALILLVLVIFLFNRNTIETVMEKTGLVEHLRNNPGEIVVDDESGSAGEPSTRNPEPADPISVEVRVVPDKPASDDPVREQEIIVSEPEPEPQTPLPVIESPRVRRSTIYFVQVGDNSEISLASVVRPVNFVDSPLTETIATLLKGLTSSEIDRGLLSLIPEGTLLRSVTIRGNVAHIDFNEAFRFNAFGREGYKYQLEQVVFTATEFQTVQSVQILIDGQRITHLGPESPYIGEPLTRDSFS